MGSLLTFSFQANEMLKETETSSTMTQMMQDNKTL